MSSLKQPQLEATLDLKPVKTVPTLALLDTKDYALAPNVRLREARQAHPTAAMSVNLPFAGRHPGVVDWLYRPRPAAASMVAEIL